jgi:hypothetical protein
MHTLPGPIRLPAEVSERKRHDANSYYSRNAGAPTIDGTFRAARLGSIASWRKRLSGHPRSRQRVVIAGYADLIRRRIL